MSIISMFKSFSGTAWAVIFIALFFLGALVARKRRGTGWHVIALATVIFLLVFAVGFGHYHLFSHPLHLPHFSGSTP